MKCIESPFAVFMGYCFQKAYKIIPTIISLLYIIYIIEYENDRTEGYTYNGYGFALPATAYGTSRMSL